MPCMSHKREKGKKVTANRTDFFDALTQKPLGPTITSRREESSIQGRRWRGAVLVPAALPRSQMEAMATHKERKDLEKEGYLERARETQLAATLLYFLLPA